MPKLMVISCHTPSLLWFRLDMMKHFISNGFDVVAIGNEDESTWQNEFSNYSIKYRKAYINRNGTNPIDDLKTQKVSDKKC